jgi:hypothetical protein
MSRCHHEADTRALAHADDDGALDVVVVEHFDCVGDELGVAVRRGVHRSIAAAIAPWVERKTVWRRANHAICAFHIWAFTIGSA